MFLGTEFTFYIGSRYTFQSRKLNTIENMLCQHKCHLHTNKITLTATPIGKTTARIYNKIAVIIHQCRRVLMTQTPDALPLNPSHFVRNLH